MYGISEKHLEYILLQLESNIRIEKVVIFGSRAKGNFKPGSDIDLALKGNELKLKDILSLQNKMDESDLPYLFDIIIYQNITEPALIEHIDRVGIEIYSKKTTLIK